MKLTEFDQQLETPRLRLRPLTLNDAVPFHQMYSDPETMSFWSSEPTASMTETQASIQADLDWIAKGDALVWALNHKKSGQVVGKCVLFNHHEQNRRAEIGYLLNRDYWGGGLMTEACTALIDFCFETLQLHRLEADADEHNAGSIALLEKLGFRQEGFFPERWRVGKKWTNSVMFGLLARNWKTAVKVPG